MATSVAICFVEEKMKHFSSRLKLLLFTTFLLIMSVMCIFFDKDLELKNTQASEANNYTEVSDK